MTMPDVETNYYDDTPVWFLSSLKIPGRTVTVYGDKDDPRTSALSHMLERFGVGHLTVNPLFQKHACSIERLHRAGVCRFPAVEISDSTTSQFVEGVDRGRVLWFLICPTL